MNAGTEPDNAGSPPGPVVVLTDRSIDPHIIVYHEPRSLQAEQYRAFRTNVFAMDQGGQKSQKGQKRGSRAIAITSAMKGEGKSVTAVNIAICIAEAPSKRVCLIDTDFRAPRVAELLGIEEGKGLSELLQDQTDLRSVIAETKVSNLSVIRAGREPRNPAELLASDRIEDLLDELKRDYTHIICDTPPVNPYTDAAVLGSRLDGVLLVVRIGRTLKDQADRARGVLERAGCNLIGLFLTEAAPVDKRETEYYRRLEE